MLHELLAKHPLVSSSPYTSQFCGAEMISQDYKTNHFQKLFPEENKRKKVGVGVKKTEDDEAIDRSYDR